MSGFTPQGGNAIFGSNNENTVLGNFFKLPPPPVTEVTPDNFSDWSYTFKNYVGTLDFRLGKTVTHLETQKTPVTTEQVLSFFDDGLDTATLATAVKNKHDDFSATELLYFEHCQWTYCFTVEKPQQST